MVGLKAFSFTSRIVTKTSCKAIVLMGKVDSAFVTAFSINSVKSETFSRPQARIHHR